MDRKSTQMSGSAQNAESFWRWPKYRSTTSIVNTTVKISSAHTLHARPTPCENHAAPTVRHHTTAWGRKVRVQPTVFPGMGDVPQRGLDASKLGGRFGDIRNDGQDNKGAVERVDDHVLLQLLHEVELHRVEQRHNDRLFGLLRPLFRCHHREQRPSANTPATRCMTIMRVAVHGVGVRMVGHGPRRRPAGTDRANRQSAPITWSWPVKAAPNVDRVGCHFLCTATWQTSTGQWSTCAPTTRACGNSVTRGGELLRA